MHTTTLSTMAPSHHREVSFSPHPAENLTPCYGMHGLICINCRKLLVWIRVILSPHLALFVYGSERPKLHCFNSRQSIPFILNEMFLLHPANIVNSFLLEQENGICKPENTRRSIKTHQLSYFCYYCFIFIVYHPLYSSIYLRDLFTSVQLMYLYG